MGRERMDVGARGEAVAAGYLIELGWNIVERNWRCPSGEIDLVARDPAGVVVVCEVKTRSGTGYGAPLESITYAKARRLRQLAADWARAHPGLVRDLRVDALGVLLRPGRTPVVEHVVGIEP